MSERYATTRHARHLQALLKDRGVEVFLGDDITRTSVELRGWYWWAGAPRRAAGDALDFRLLDTSPLVFVRNGVTRATPLDADTFKLKFVGEGTLERCADRLKEMLDLADAQALGETLE